MNSPRAEPERGRRPRPPRSAAHGKQRARPPDDSRARPPRRLPRRPPRRPHPRRAPAGVSRHRWTSRAQAWPPSSSRGSPRTSCAVGLRHSPALTAPAARRAAARTAPCQCRPPLDPRRAAAAALCRARRARHSATTRRLGGPHRASARRRAGPSDARARARAPSLAPSHDHAACRRRHRRRDRRAGVYPTSPPTPAAACSTFAPRRVCRARPQLRARLPGSARSHVAHRAVRPAAVRCAAPRS